MLDALKLSPEVKIEADKDVLGGGGPLSTDIYGMTCEYLYLDQTKSGAVMCYGNFKENNTGRNIRFSECVMSKKSGTLKATYTDKNTGDEKPLPGYSRVFHLAQVLGLNVADLSGLACEAKFLNLWDREQRKEVPQEKNILTDFTGRQLQAAVYKVLETKMEDDGSGTWNVPTSEEFAKNDLVKWFSADGLTAEELVNGVGDVPFKDEWLKAHKGKERDNRVKDAPKAGAPALGGNTPAGGGIKFD